MSVAELKAIGVEARRVLKAVRDNCIDCMSGNAAEVRRCAAVKCPMWAFRLGTNPFHRREMTDEQRDELRERGSRLAATSKAIKLTGQTPDRLSPVSDSPEDPEAAGDETLQAERPMPADTMEVARRIMRERAVDSSKQETE